MSGPKSNPTARQKGRKGKRQISDNSYASVTAHYLEKYADAYEAFANNAYVDKRWSGHDDDTDPYGYRSNVQSGFGALGFHKPS
jgi:hypothetical protein